MQKKLFYGFVVHAGPGPCGCCRRPGARPGPDFAQQMPARGPTSGQLWSAWAAADDVCAVGGHFAAVRLAASARRQMLPRVSPRIPMQPNPSRALCRAPDSTELARARACVVRGGNLVRAHAGESALGPHWEREDDPSPECARCLLQTGHVDGYAGAAHGSGLLEIGDWGRTGGQCSQLFEKAGQ